jgi:hypothetical protein
LISWAILERMLESDGEGRRGGEEGERGEEGVEEELRDFSYGGGR